MMISCASRGQLSRIQIAAYHRVRRSHRCSCSAFHKPAFIGNLVTIKAVINMTGRTSMEIGARVETEDLMTGVKTHLASAYLTFVALDDNHRPAEIPPLKLITEEDLRRNREALDRRKSRLSEKTKESQCQADNSKCL